MQRDLTFSGTFPVREIIRPFTFHVFQVVNSAIQERGREGWRNRIGLYTHTWAVFPFILWIETNKQTFLPQVNITKSEQSFPSVVRKDFFFFSNPQGIYICKILDDLKSIKKKKKTKTGSRKTNTQHIFTNLFFFFFCFSYSFLSVKDSLSLLWWTNEMIREIFL